MCLCEKNIMKTNYHLYSPPNLSLSDDVGNYAAGYIAGKKGLSWGEARFGFDALQSAVDSFRARSITRSTEGPESRAAQYKGFIDGKANFNNVWKNLDVMF